MLLLIEPWPWSYLACYFWAPQQHRDTTGLELWNKQRTRNRALDRTQHNTGLVVAEHVVKAHDVALRRRQQQVHRPAPQQYVRQRQRSERGQSVRQRSERAVVGPFSAAFSALVFTVCFSFRHEVTLLVAHRTHSFFKIVMHMCIDAQTCSWFSSKFDHYIMCW